MNKTAASNHSVASTPLAKSVSEISFKVTRQNKGLREYLKLLDTGELQLEDVESIVNEFNSQPQLGDVIQYELHKYCKKDISITNTDLIVRLAELCYSNASVEHFSNIDRFVGCVFFISSHLLKKERFEPALAVVSSLAQKKEEIVEYSKQKAEIRNFVCNIHSSLMVSAIGLAGKVKNPSDNTNQICQNLVMESLNVFNLTTGEQLEAGKKVLKTTALYLQTLKWYKEEDVVQFFQALRETLKIILPKMGALDYFLYYVSKMNHTKKPDSEAELEKDLRKTVDLLVLFLNSSPDVGRIFGKLLDFFWTDSGEDKWITEEEFEVLNGNPSHRDLHLLLVSTVVNYGMQFLWTKFEKTWSTRMTVSLVEKVSNSVLAVHKSLSGGHFYCSSLKLPLGACFGDLITGNLHKIQYTVRVCLKNKLPNALSLVSISREAFRLSMECVENMKSGCCEKQRIFWWKFSVIHHTNTVEDVSRMTSSEESWFYLKECSRDVLKEVIDSDVDLPFGFPRVKILFHRWHTGSLKLKNHQEALSACIVYYVFYPTEETDIMSMWLQTKAESSNEIIQEITVAEMLKTSDQDLRDFSKTYNSSKVCLKSALLMELKAYSSCLPDTFQNPNTAYTLCARVWKQLEKMKLDLWESSLGVSSLILASLVGENENLSFSFQEKCQKLIDAFMVQQRKGEMQCRSLLHAANLTFSLFLYNVKMSERAERKRDTAQMVLGYLKKAEEEKVKFGEEADLNLTCDVIPSSRHLTVELETNYIQELNRVVELWRDALQCKGKEVPLSSELDLWLRKVKQVANMYEMYGEYQRALVAWVLYYKVGILCNNSGASLLGLSHLIRNCSDVDSSGLKEEAELISEKLSSESVEKHVVLEYFLAMASNYLKNKKSDKCLEYLTRGRRMLEGLPAAMKSYTLNAKFWCLVSQFLVVYGEYGAAFDYPVGTDVRLIALKAFGYANGGGRSELIKSVAQSDCTEHVLAMFEVSLWAYRLHGVYRQTDFMRLFLDDLYQIVQRLFLPTRTAEMLARLAEVDMICEKGPDCQEKVLKLKSILNISPPTVGENKKLEKPASPFLQVPQKVCEFESTMARPISPVRFLNKRSKPKDLDLSPGELYLESSKIFKSDVHPKNCKCRTCQNLLIQTLTMNTVCLEAEIHSQKNSTREAAACYGQACEVLNKLEVARAEQSRSLREELTSELKEDPGEVDLKLAFVRFHSASFLMKLALFESSSLKSVTENVLKTVRRIRKLMEEFSYEEKLLQWAFTELKLFCVVLNKGVMKSPKKKTPVVHNASAIERTPLVGVGKTPVITNTVRRPEKSPRPCLEGETKSKDDAMNTGFLEMKNAKTLKKLIRPKKLNFQTNEPETKSTQISNAEEEEEVSKERPSVIPSRKLDFDLSGDLFEETPAPPQTRRKGEAARKATKPTLNSTVKIYTDSTTTKAAGKKPKRGETKKADTKRKTTKTTTAAASTRKT